MSKTMSVTPSPFQMAVRHEMIDVAKRYEDHLKPEDMLAVLCYVVGQMAAALDQREFSSEDVKALILDNIEHGNADFIQFYLGKPEGQA